METLTFQDFLGILEDTQTDVAKLMSDLAMIDTQINQRTQPLLARKQQLQKLLAMKQKQSQAELKKAGNTPEQQQGAMQAQANQTTTPGGSGSGTPGSAASAMPR